MKFLNDILLSKAQKLLIERQIAVEVKMVRAKDKAMMKDQFKRHMRREALIRQEVDIEKSHYKTLQSKLEKDREECRDVEELYAYRILAMSKILEAIKKICKLFENFIVLDGEIKESLAILESSPDKQEIIDRIFKRSKIMSMPKK